MNICFPNKNISITKEIFVFLLVILYIISPIDIIPDVPPVGWLDDILALLWLIVHLVMVFGKKQDVLTTITKSIDNIIIMLFIMSIALIGTVVCLILNLFQ